MVKKDENTDINKENSLEGSEKIPPAKKRGRPRKIKVEAKEEISEKKEATEQVSIESNIPKEIDETIPKISEEETKEEQQIDKIPEEQSIKIIPVSEEENPELDIPEEKLKRKSNYQISLVDENHLRTRVLTNKLVGIVCSVKDKYSYAENLGERQTNKIFVHPKEKPQEVEIMVSIGSLPISEDKKGEIQENIIESKIEKDSNYQVSLVDENLLRILVVTEKSISIDCSVKDEDVHKDGSNETQANKIFIHPKEKPQEIEIIVSIGVANESIIGETSIPIETTESHSIPLSQKAKLTPNPIVANLIQKFTDTTFEEDNGVFKTPEERLEEKLGPKNPWKLYKELMHRNLIVGLIGAVLIYIIFVVSFYSIASKKNNNSDVVEAPRLIVMQDLPENQFQQQNVEDPNKPPEEEKSSDDGANPNKIPPITPKKIKPPRVIGPPKQKTDTSTAIDKELDSLRKVNQNIISNNKTGDSTKSVSGNYPIPDSIMRSLKENEVGLFGRFPPNWKQIDSREVNLSKEFTGVLLVDTVPEKKAERLTMNVQIDRNSEYWKQYSFKNIFSEDSLKNVIYNIEPKQEGDQTYYRFYISGMAYNIYIAAFINNEHFDKHKAEIEQVVRTIRIQKPATPPGK